MLGERNWLADHDLAVNGRRAFGEWPLRFQPGSHWLYSHGMDIAARLVEIMSGLPYDEYLRTAIFEPLGMTDTEFWVPADKVDRFAAVLRAQRPQGAGADGRPDHQHLPAASRSCSTAAAAWSAPPPTTSGSARCSPAAARSTAGACLSRKTLELMTTNHLPGDGDMSDFALPMGYGEVGFAGNGFGLTVAVSKGPQASGEVGSAGAFMWGGAASTTFWVDPSEELAVVFMTQLLPSGTFNFRGQLRSLVYAALL